MIFKLLCGASKGFYEGSKGLHKNFWGTIKKCENKNLTYFFFYFKTTFRNVQDVKGYKIEIYIGDIIW